MDNTDWEYTVDRNDGHRIVLKEFVDIKAFVPWPQVTLAVHNGVLVVSGQRWMLTHQVPTFRLVPAVAAQLAAQHRPSR